MSEGIVYFSTGEKHLVRLAVSVMTLRDHYGGPVTIVHVRSNEGLLECIAADGRCDLLKVDAPAWQRNTHYVLKPRMIRWSPYKRSVYLDSDMTVHANPIELLELLHRPLLFTQFCDWVTTGPMMQKRIDKWRHVVVDDFNCADSADRMSGQALPALNTGVFAWEKSDWVTGIRKLWEGLCEANRIFMADELAAQMILGRHDWAVSVADDSWNWSPMLSNRPREEAKIYHYHGNKHAKSPKGRELWLPLYERALQSGFAAIDTWAPRGDKWLKHWLDGALA